MFPQLFFPIKKNVFLFSRHIKGWTKTSFLKYFLVGALFLAPVKIFAWGAEGHAIVGRLALRFVKDDVRKNVLNILGNMTVDTAANWMDIVKSNSDYDFMRSWHYLDFPRGKLYEVTNNDNIINRLLLTYKELQHKKTLCADQVKTDLYILLHLMGDLHMPLHTGYEDDLGGNKIIVQYDTIKTHNLHRFWDEDIIAISKITEQDCMDLYTSGAKNAVDTIDFTKWMEDSRSLLPAVYDFPDFRLNKQYLQKNTLVVKQQLLKAGLRLAAVLNMLFESSAPAIDYKAAAKKYKNSISLEEASAHIGENVTVCASVSTIRSTATITQINLLNPDNNSKLVVVIFGKNYASFVESPLKLYANKNICVRGKLELYNNKPQIIVDNPNDITVL